MVRSIRIDTIVPFLGERDVEIATWGSAFSALAAGRRWSLTGDGGGSIEVDSVWIHLDGAARPARIGGGFDAYALAAQGRSASTRLTLPDPPADAARAPWPLRSTDVDVMGHVNNAAYWSAIEHRLGGRSPHLLRGPLRARLDYRHPLDLDDEAVETAQFPLEGGLGLAFVVGATVKAVAYVEELGRSGSLEVAALDEHRPREHDE